MIICDCCHRMEEQCRDDTPVKGLPAGICTYAMLFEALSDEDRPIQNCTPVINMKKHLCRRCAVHLREHIGVANNVALLPWAHRLPQPIAIAGKARKPVKAKPMEREVDLTESTSGS